MAAQIPKLVKGVASGDLRALPLAPIDGFVLSRINGILSVPEIAAGTGLGEPAVRQTVAKLQSLGIVEFAGEGKSGLSPPKSGAVAANASKPVAANLTPLPPRPPSSLAGATARPPPKPAEGKTSPPPIADPQRTRLDAPNQSPLAYDPRELDEDVDLEMPQRRRVLELFYRLPDLNYYTLLGIPRAADKKAVKRAYFELASLFHPDKFFRKRLGGFKPKMEAIFGKITEAHDTLTSKEQRPEYDAYLGAQDQSRGIESLMESAMAEVARAAEELQRSVVQNPPPVSPATGSVRPAPSPRAPLPDLDPQARREALARRLTGGGPPPRGTSPPPPPKMPGNFANSKEAVDALKRRYEDRLADAHTSQARKYADAGRAAEAKKDMVAAATSFRIALSFTPNDADLRAAYEKTQGEADLILADSYLKQANYEERSEHWTEAAKSWGRLARARPTDARAHERQANALIKSTGNLHEAAAAAKRAVALEGNRADFKTTLATVYMAAGLTLNAKRELEAAVVLEPDNAALQAFLKRVQKAG